MLQASLFIALSLATLGGTANAKDPACRASNRAPIFQTLRSCERLYCGEPKNAGTPAALKIMDDAFTEHKVKTNAVLKLIHTYQKDFCENLRLNRKSGPEVSAWRQIGFTVQDDLEELDKLNKSFKDFEPTLEAIHKVELDLACFRQVNEVKMEADKLTEFAIGIFRKTGSTMCSSKK